MPIVSRLKPVVIAVPSYHGVDSGVPMTKINKQGE
jgi:hypothetical protein